MKRLLLLGLTAWLGMDPDAAAQGTNPLRIVCPPNQTNWVCGVASTAIVRYPTPSTTASCSANAVVTCTPASGSLFALGTTTVTCRATNTCRETAVCTFTVTVARDVTPPVILCPGSLNVTACSASGAVVNFPTPSATDNADSNVVVTCVPASGSLFPLGSTTVVCTATDDCTNRSTCTFVVSVVRDTTPPVIECPSNLVFNCVSPDVPIVLDFFKPKVTDDHDPNPTVVCEPPSLVSSPGTHLVTCTATDRCSNRSQCQFTVTFNDDTTPPVLNCPTDLTVWSCTGSAVVRYAVTATDNCSSNVNVVCNPPSGSTFPLGVSTVVCSATDARTNRSTCTFTVTVRPPFYYDGLCHSSLGRATLQVNGESELEVGDLGLSGEDGVRVTLADNPPPGLLAKIQIATQAIPTNSQIWQKAYGRTTAGAEILASEVMYSFAGGRLSVTPSGPSYGLTLFRNGAVVYRENARTGAFDLPCINVWNEVCWGENQPPEFPVNPLLPVCVSFLALVCEVDTPSGPVQADAFAITPNVSLPPLSALTALEFLGRNVPVLKLRRERLLLFGDALQPPVAHQAKGVARYDVDFDAWPSKIYVPVTNVGTNGQDGVAIELGASAGLRWGLLHPTGNPEGDLTFDVFGRTAAGTEVLVRRISHHYRGGRRSVTPGSGLYEAKLLRQGQVVFRQGGRTGEFDLPPCDFVESEHCVGEPFEGWNPHVPYCITFLSVECVWETPNGPVQADTLVLTPEDPAPPIASISTVQILGRNGRGLDSFVLTSERVLKFGGTGPLRVSCPPDITVPTCSTNPVPIRFLLPVVNGGTCTSAPTVRCVPASGSLFPPGVTTVQCTATNACGERAVCSFRVTIDADTTPPSLVCPTNLNVVVAACGAPGAVVEFPLPTISGPPDPQTRVSCVPTSGSFFPVGTSTVTCTAEDACGRRGTCTFTVTVRPRPFFNGLCHSPLGLAALKLNPAGELEVSGFGSTGQDGLRIDLGESQGLRWWMKHPVVPTGRPEGRLDVELLGKTSSGSEISLSRMTYVYRNGRVAVTPNAATYEIKLLLDGAVVYRQGGRSGTFDLPVCIPDWTPHCWGEEPSEFPDNPLLPHCLWLLSLSCDVPTDSGPVHADTLVLTPESPRPPFVSLSAVQILGRDVPGVALREESLMMFGGAGEKSRPHRALGQARLVAAGGRLTVGNLGRGGADGVSVGFELPGGGPDLPVVRGGEVALEPLPLAPGERLETAVYTRLNGRPAAWLGALTFAQLSAAEAQLGSECGIFWHLKREEVYLAGQSVGGASLPVPDPLSTLGAVGAGMPRLTRIAKLPGMPLAFALTFDRAGVFTLHNGTRLIGDEIRVLLYGPPEDTAELSSLELTSTSASGLTLVSERVLTPLALVCPSDLTLRVCSTNRVPVNYLPPVVIGGHCASPPTVVCTPPSGALFAPGTNVVHCLATNLCGETAECRFTVTIHADTTVAPLECPTNLVVYTPSASGRAVCYAVPAVRETNAIVACDPPSGSVFPIGTNRVTCTVMDSCGNRQTCQFLIEVRLQKLRLVQAAALQLAWDGEAVLQSADDVMGPWLNVERARSPYQVSPVGPRKFFRLSSPLEPSSSPGAESGPGDCPCGQVGGAGGVWDFDVPSVRVQGAFRLNGQPFPGSFLHGANFFLRNAATGDEVYLGLSNDGTFDRRVIPGTYDIVYEHKVGTDVPLNSQAVLQPIELSADRLLNIDVPAVRMTGTLTLNGAAPPVSAGESGKILVRDERNGAQTEIGRTHLQTYGALLIPGTYDVLYSYIGGSVVPMNSLGMVRPDVNIAAAGVLNLDVPTVEVGGRFLYDGLMAPDSPAENGAVYFVDAATQGEAFVGQTRGLNYLVQVIPGGYDVVYRKLSAGAVAPANSNARFQRGATFSQDTVFDVNIPTVTVSGDFRVNGVAAPNNPGESARIWLRAGQDLCALGVTHGGSYQVKVVPGDYDILFESVSSGAVMPANTNTVIGSRRIVDRTLLPINIPAVTYSAEVRFDGATLLNPPGDDACRLYLEHVASADPVYAGVYPDPGQLFRVVIPGVYRIRYEYRAGTRLPRNQFAAVGNEFPLLANLATQLDIRSAPLSGDFRLNGTPFPAGPGQNAAIVLRGTGRSRGDSIHLGGTAGGSYSTTVIPGQYRPLYNWAVGDLVPRNQQAEIGCPQP